jgi:hypothetical protein
MLFKELKIKDLSNLIQRHENIPSLGYAISFSGKQI